MYNFIIGKAVYTEDNTVVLQCGGIGYEIICTINAKNKVADTEDVKLFTYLALSDGLPVLYGFSTIDERELFLKLITVTGVGAKLAVNILSAMPLKELSIAIVSGDSARLARIKGLGKKTSERIILELKEKIHAVASECSGGGELKLAEATLTALGIGRAEAVELVSRVAEAGDNAEQIILKALKESK